MEKKYWQHLKAGDIVEVIAPSSAVITPDISSYLIKIKQLFNSLGLIAKFNNDIISPEKDLFSANSLDYRVSNLQAALNNSESKAIWCLRGGYGASKIIPYLEQMDQPQPKLLIGFSDITAIHLLIQQKWQWPSIHGPVVSQIINNENLLLPLIPLLFGKQQSISFDQLTKLNTHCNNKNIIEAKIIGGNLSIVTSSLGTSWQIDASNRIIFLEDVGERGYRIDRMLTQLDQAGIFNQAKAIIFGQFINGKEPDGSDLTMQTLQNFSASVNIPVLYFPSFGHSSDLNLPLPLGTESILDLNKQSLKCLSGGTIINEVNINVNG